MDYGELTKRVELQGAKLAPRGDSAVSRHKGQRFEAEVVQQLLASGIAPSKIRESMTLESNGPLAEFDILIQTKSGMVLVDVKTSDLEVKQPKPSQQVKLAAADGALLGVPVILYRPNWDERWPQFAAVSTLGTLLKVRIAANFADLLSMVS